MNSNSSAPRAFDMTQLHPNSQFRNGAFLSLDTATFIIEQVTIRGLMHWLKLAKYAREGFNHFEVKIHPGCDAFVLDCNGVQFRVNKSFMQIYDMDPKAEDTLDFVFPSVNVNITGQGMKFLRQLYASEKIWADQFILYFIAKHFPDRGHFTRLDFALDFVNDFSNIMNNMIRHLNYGASGGNPGCFTGGTKYYKSKIYLSDNGGQTIYLGSTASDQMLRVYNKYAEQTDENGIWKERPNFSCITPEEIRTWVRFELVLRGKKAIEYSPIDAESNSVLGHPELFVNLLYTKFKPASNTFMPEWWHDFWKPVLDYPERIQLNTSFV